MTAHEEEQTTLEVPEETPLVLKKKSAKKKSKKKAKKQEETITVSLSDLDAIIQKRVDDAMSANNSLQLPAPDTSTLKPGMTVPPGTMPPSDWQIIALDNGTMQLWPLPPEGFDPEKRRKVLDQVDQAYTAALPTKEMMAAGQAYMPDRLYVSRAWRDLFPNVRSWGDECDILVDEERFSKRNLEGVRFEFHVPTVAETPSMVT
jgi:hypothetical protein